MKTLILIQDDEVRIYSVEDESDAKYYFNRRIEKEGWTAHKAYLVDETNLLDVVTWESEYWAVKAEFERLKKKFEK